MVQIGIPCETKDGERRVALAPDAVAELSGAGFKVTVEKGAGRHAGAFDSDYLSAGAAISEDAAGVWSSDLVVKVKEPQPDEYRWFREDLTLFCFLHLAAEPRLAEAMDVSGVRAVAFEDVTVGGVRPILAAMSQVAGRAAALVGGNLLSSAHQGSGVLLGGVDGVDPAEAVVIGLGAAGCAAASGLKASGARVVGIDVDGERLASCMSGGLVDAGYRPGTFLSDAALTRADLVVGAALSPGRRAPVVMTEPQVKRMRRGSVIVDVAVDQGGCVETTRPTSLTDPTFVKYGVTHYCVPNMPGQFPLTATAALSRVLLTHVEDLAGVLRG